MSHKGNQEVRTFVLCGNYSDFLVWCQEQGVSPPTVEFPNYPEDIENQSNVYMLEVPGAERHPRYEDIKAAWQRKNDQTRQDVSQCEQEEDNEVGKALVAKTSTIEADSRSVTEDDETTPYDRLSINHKRFVDAYMATRQQGKAYTMVYGVGPPQSYVAAYTLMQKEHIKEALAYLDSRLEARTLVTAEKIIRERARVAFASVKSLYDDQGNLLPLHELSDDDAAAIAEVREIVKYGGEGKQGASTKQYRMHDKDKALAALERIYGLGGERTDDSQGEGIIINIGVGVQNNIPGNVDSGDLGADVVDVRLEEDETP